MERLIRRVLSVFLLVSAINANGTDGDSSGENAPADENNYYGLIIRIDSAEADETIGSLENMGVKVLYRRDDLLLCFVPEDMEDAGGGDTSTETKSESDNVSSIRRVKGVIEMERGDSSAGGMRGIRGKTIPRRMPITPAMDFARTLGAIDDIHNGIGLPSPFDGTGVVTGFCDIGFDTRHISFMNADGTECRVRRVVKYTDDKGLREVFSTPREIYDMHTDNPDNFHATHVAGIMAGGCVSSGLQGVAPGADIVATMSQLSDVALLAGVEDVIDYAKSMGKPAVVNLSVSSYTGPHDGTSLFCQYLDRCAEDAIVVFSAGNEGNSTNNLARTFSETADNLRFILCRNDWKHFNMTGITEVWSDTSEPVELKILVQEDTSASGQITYQSDYISFPAQGGQYIVTSDESLDGLEGVYHYSADFAAHHSGLVALEGGIDSENGRYFVRMYYNCESSEPVSDTKKWARWRLGGIAKGAPGVHAECYTDGSYSYFGYMSGVSPRPDSHASISDIATGRNVITVGMYQSKPTVELLSGSVIGDESDEAYTISSSSSYGTLADGRIFPHTVAPGVNIVSAMSGAYLEAHPSMTSNCSYVAQDHYWYPMSGTSMASPYVAGAIATWLQAKPELTTAEVQKIIASTNNSADYPVTANPRYGQGYFRPYAGLLEVLKNSTVDVQDTLQKSIFASVSKGVLEILNPDGRDLQVEIFDITGRRLYSEAIGSAATIAIPLDRIGIDFRGIAICRITAPGATPLTLKTIY